MVLGAADRDGPCASPYKQCFAGVGHGVGTRPRGSWTALTPTPDRAVGQHWGWPTCSQRER